MQVIPPIIATREEDERRAKAAERVQRKLGGVPLAGAAPALAAVAAPSGSGGSGAVAAATGAAGVEGGGRCEGRTGPGVEAGRVCLHPE